MSYAKKLKRISCQCLLISSLSSKTRNSVGMARLTEPVRRVSVRTWYQETLTWFSIYHASSQNNEAWRASTKWNANAVSSELADVVNSLWRRFFDAFWPIECYYHGQRMYVASPRQRSLLKESPAMAQAQFYLHMVSCYQEKFYSRCMIKYNQQYC